MRLALEDAGAEYVDVARLPAQAGGGVAAMLRAQRAASKDLAPFAPPFLKCEGEVVAHAAHILAFLGPRLGLVPTDERARRRAHQLQLSVTDLFAEVHDAHHPVGTGLYYEDQKPEAERRTLGLVEERLPKYLGYFEGVLERAGGRYFVGAAPSYVDLSLFQVMAGLSYAFPRAFKRLTPSVPSLRRLARRVAKRPRLAAYLASPRRIPFNEDGIFRHYPELDR